jgi:GNAT superfamily N-acetyltransferase
MKQLAIIPQEEDNIEPKLSDCVERLENARVWVYAFHRGRGYAVIWADDQLIERAIQILRDAGFDVAPLTHSRSLQIRTPAPAITVSNQNSHEQATR